MTIRMLLADDHRLLRESLAGLFEARGMVVVGQADSGPEAVALARATVPDVVLMDLSMPGGGGLEATRLIKAVLPATSVVILTASEDEADLFEAVKSGAQGYLLKSYDPATVIQLVEAAARGEPALTPQLASRILVEFARGASFETTAAGEPAPPRPPRSRADVPEELRVEPLTAREVEVLECLVTGMTNREIAARLIVSENTVKYHLRNILQKLHLQNRSQVVAFALRHGLTDDA